ncbi:hypothetical protein FKP32DRAFT_441284 [Trametes sanguinea]|nr:hypothetical protein FKP32DRAFT_441284 [Trametes sanguinea]
MDWRSEAKTLAPVPSKSKLLLSPVQRRKRAIEKIKAAHAARPSRRSPSLKIRVMGSPNRTSRVDSLSQALTCATVPAKPQLTPPRLPAKPSSSSSKNPAIQAAPLVRKAPVFIDLTVDSDSDSDNEPSFFRHPLVTPRIPRTSAATASKRATPAPVAAAAADTHDESDSEWEDETMLENMLTAPDAFSESDMDCGSSDVESPAGPSNLAPFLIRSGSAGDPLDVGTPPNVRATRRLYG